MRHQDCDALQRFFRSAHEQLRDDDKKTSGLLAALEQWEVKLSKCRMSVAERRRAAAVFDALRDARRERRSLNLARARWNDSVKLLGVMVGTWQPDVTSPPQDGVV